MQTNPESAAVEAVAAIGRLICTQDNRITDQPIFIVQQKRQYITNPDYNEGRQIWVDDEGNEVSRKTRGAECLYVHDVWEFVTACFTEQGCKDYIAKDGHNLRESRIYAAGSFRNDEYRTVRKFLMGMSDHQSALDALRGEVEDLKAQLAREEHSHGQTIDDRDRAEEALGDMFMAVTGREAEWSSAWDYADAIQEVEEHMSTLTKESP